MRDRLGFKAPTDPHLRPSREKSILEGFSWVPPGLPTHKVGVNIHRTRPQTVTRFGHSECYFCAFEPPVSVYCRERDQTDLNSPCHTAPLFCLFSYFSFRPCSFYSPFTFSLCDFLRSVPGILFLARVLKIFTVNKSFRAAVKFAVFCPTCSWNSSHGEHIGRSAKLASRFCQVQSFHADAIVAIILCCQCAGVSVVMENGPCRA